MEESTLTNQPATDVKCFNGVLNVSDVDFRSCRTSHCFIVREICQSNTSGKVRFGCFPEIQRASDVSGINPSQRRNSYPTLRQRSVIQLRHKHVGKYSDWKNVLSLSPLLSLSPPTHLTLGPIQVSVPSLEVVERHAGKCRKSLTDIEVDISAGRAGGGKIRHRKCKLLYKITLGVHSTHPQINDI